MSVQQLLDTRLIEFTRVLPYPSVDLEHAATIAQQTELPHKDPPHPRFRVLTPQRQTFHLLRLSPSCWRPRTRHASLHHIIDAPARFPHSLPPPTRALTPCVSAIPKSRHVSRLVAGGDAIAHCTSGPDWATNMRTPSQTSYSSGCQEAQLMNKNDKRGGGAQTPSPQPADYIHPRHMCYASRDAQPYHQSQPRPLSPTHAYAYAEAMLFKPVPKSRSPVTEQAASSSAISNH